MVYCVSVGTVKQEILGSDLPFVTNLPLALVGMCKALSSIYSLGFILS